MIKFELEYEIPQLRHAHVWCPSCEHKFNAREHGNRDDGGKIYDGVDIEFAEFTCPNCGEYFSTRGKDIDITEY